MLMAALRLGASLGNLGLIFVISKFYGTEHLGVSSLIIAAALGISTLAKFGYDILAIKYLPSYISKGDWGSTKSFVSYFSIRTVFGLIMLLPMYLFLTESEVDAISVAVIAFSLTGMAVLSSIIKSSLRPVLSAFYEIGYGFLVAGMVLGCLGLLQVMLDAVQVQRVVACVLAVYFFGLLIFTRLLYKRLFVADRLRMDSSKVREMNVNSVNFMMITITGYFYSYGYVWLTGEFFDIATVAFIAVIARVVFAVNFSMMIANAIYNPRFAIACERNKKEDIEALAGSSLKMMMLFSVPPFLIIMMFPAEILALFGISAVDAKNCLILMAIAQMVNVVTGNAASILNLSGDEKIVRNNAVAHLVGATVAGFALSSYFGIIGLVLAYAIGIASQNIVLTYILMVWRNINIYKGFLRG